MSSNHVQAAYDHARAGRRADAIALLEAAGAQGESTAWAELASWYPRGDLVPRDLARARAALRRAVAIGHIDAALLEIALVANGTGGRADWPSALALLRQAAADDPVAAQQLALLDRMQIDNNGQPTTLPQADMLSQQPFIARYAQAVTPAECLHLAQIAHADLQPGVVIDPATGRQIQHPIRTSHNATVGPAQEDLVVAALNRRLAGITGITGTTVANAEPLQILRYTPGQEYRLHSDALSGVTNQRIVTAIVYLNDGFAGGETDFPGIGVRVRPRAGDILVFHNSQADGRADPLARHAGLPVTSGTKWIATRWIRAAAYDPWSASSPG